MANTFDSGDPQFQTPQIYTEGTWLYGAMVTAILYGIVVVLYFMCARSLWAQLRANDSSRKKHIFFFVYVHFLFALGTLYVAANSRITQLGFINYRDFPGGESFSCSSNTIPSFIPSPQVLALMK